MGLNCQLMGLVGGAELSVDGVELLVGGAELSVVGLSCW